MAEAVVVAGDHRVGRCGLLGHVGRDRGDGIGLDTGLIAQDEHEAGGGAVDPVDGGHDGGRAALPVVGDLDHVELVEIHLGPDAGGRAADGHDPLINRRGPNPVEGGAEHRRRAERQRLLRSPETAG
jgi:hypothetical protein